ncbi:hypothetical protein CFP56_021063 [Quercus suber]|uniref:Uncharacterized protein n=1 Tax=Quercus suber TaxID=58331 RepID=A0AAW0IQF7_QUESU
MRSANERGFINNITRVGRDVLQLTEARPYYFLSSGGYCYAYHGIRAAVYVETSPTPATNGSPSNTPTPFDSSVHSILHSFCIWPSCSKQLQGFAWKMNT